MKTISESEYRNISQFKSPIHFVELVLIEFGASWCLPCKTMTRTLEGMEANYKDKVLFVKMDVDDCPFVSEELNIKSVPTTIIMKNGEILDILFGVQRKDKIDSVLKSLI